MKVDIGDKTPRAVIKPGFLHDAICVTVDDGHRYLRCQGRGKCGGCRNEGMDCMYEALSVCSICGGLEGALLPKCPGHQLTADEHDANYDHYCRGTGPFACAKHGQASHGICEACYKERGTYAPVRL